MIHGEAWDVSGRGGLKHCLICVLWREREIWRILRYPRGIRSPFTLDLVPLFVQIAIRSYTNQKTAIFEQRSPHRCLIVKAVLA